MYNNKIAELMVANLVDELRKGLRFVAYEDERLFNRALEQAETLHLMVIGLAALDYVEVDAPHDNAFQMERASAMPWFMNGMDE